MATKQAVARMFATFARVYLGTVDEQRVALYSAALADLTDEQLDAAVVVVVRTHPGEYLPVPAIIRRAVPAMTETGAGAGLESDAVIRAIERHAVYNAAAGMLYPRVEQIRSLFGDAIAELVAGCGGAARLFDDDDTRRDMARGEFRKAYAAAHAKSKAAGAQLVAPSALIAAVEPKRLLASSTERRQTSHPAECTRCGVAVGEEHAPDCTVARLTNVGIEEPRPTDGAATVSALAAMEREIAHNVAMRTGARHIEQEQQREADRRIEEALAAGDPLAEVASRNRARRQR